MTSDDPNIQQTSKKIVKDITYHQLVYELYVYPVDALTIGFRKYEDQVSELNQLKKEHLRAMQNKDERHQEHLKYQESIRFHKK